MGLTVINESEILPKYLYYFMLSFDLASISKSANIPMINNGDIYSIKFPKPSIAIQQDVINDLDRKTLILEGLGKMKIEAETKINQILADVWGVEFVEPENILVEDEQEN
jgi:restriction endonuclease S subunit